MSDNNQVHNMIPIHSVDSAISNFFASHTKATQEECNERAAALTGTHVMPIAVQGAFSYTVVGGSPPRLVQFRTLDSELDVDILHLARSIHGNVIASSTHSGYIGHSEPLSVYIIEMLPGVTYMEWCITNGGDAILSPEEYQRQKNTIMDFARFFAASWKNPQPMDAHLIQDKFASKLQLLAQNLPSRFSTSVSDLRNNLPILFSEGYPGVLTHGDLSEMNFLVNPETGHLTGVIDWAEAEILPFGCALWGLENLLGLMDMDGWHYFDSYKELEDLFWRVFDDTVNEDFGEKRGIISIARKIGILFRYGFRWDKDSQQRIITEEDSGMKYLDAFIGQRV